ncbi:hypothetical protein F5Y19DRAFT_58809 [Xylariaceae sp. FL1651]|nr:hypothetical protein F5Y19DRAFT_58809 [Xylariaceae sp. FL1651]
MSMLSMRPLQQVSGRFRDRYTDGTKSLEKVSSQPRTETLHLARDRKQEANQTDRVMETRMTRAIMGGQGTIKRGKRGGVFEVGRLARHRVDTGTFTVDFQVEWVGAGTSWELE